MVVTQACSAGLATLLLDEALFLIMQADRLLPGRRFAFDCTDEAEEEMRSRRASAT